MGERSYFSGRLLVRWSIEIHHVYRMFWITEVGEVRSFPHFYAPCLTQCWQVPSRKKQLSTAGLVGTSVWRCANAHTWRVSSCPFLQRITCHGRILLNKLTSSSAILVRVYIVAICHPAWDLLGSVSMMLFRVASFFLVGGGRRITGGTLGTKVVISIIGKFTAACWHEHPNTTQVSTWTSWSRVSRLLENSWSTSPSLTGKPFSWMSITHYCNSWSLEISSSVW